MSDAVVADSAAAAAEAPPSTITYCTYTNETQLPVIADMMAIALSEPYSDFTYRYFLNQWPHLAFLAKDGERCIGAIVCRLDYHRGQTLRGYIAMLVVDQEYRKRGIGSQLVRKAIQSMIDNGAEEVSLETEATNSKALSLYENLGFVRDKRLKKYYLNGGDAFRLKLWLR